MGEHVHRWQCLPYEDGIVIEKCACGAVTFGISDWGASDVNHPDYAVKELLTRAEELNSTLGKEGVGMPVERLKRVNELPPGFSPRPVIPDGINLWQRNMLMARWHDANRQAIVEVYTKDGFTGLERLGISFATAKGLFKRWEKTDQRAAEARPTDKPPAPEELSQQSGNHPAEPPPGSAPPPGTPIEGIAWPAFGELPDLVDVRVKWLDKTCELALAGKVVLR